MCCGEQMTSLRVQRKCLMKCRGIIDEVEDDGEWSVSGAQADRVFIQG